MKLWRSIGQSPRTNAGFDNAILQHFFHLFFNFITMIVTRAIDSLFYGSRIASINIVFHKGGGTGTISNTRSKDTRVLHHIVQPLTLVGQKVTLGKVDR